MAAASSPIVKQDLSVESRTVFQEKRAFGRRKLREWLKILEEVAAMDRAGESKIPKWSVGAVAAGIVAVGLLFFSFGTPLLGIPCVAVFGICAYCGLQWWRLKKEDLAGDFHTTLIPVLKVLREDIDPDARLNLRLDLSGPTKEKVVEDKTLPPGRFRKLRHVGYRDPWCRVVAPLAQGGRLIVTITNTYLEEQRSWKSSRGKLKSKTKWKKRVLVTAGIIPDPTRFVFDRDAVQGLADRERARRAKKTETQSDGFTNKFRFRVVNKGDARVGLLTRSVKIKAENIRPDHGVPPDDLVGMFFQLASLLRPVQAKG